MIETFIQRQLINWMGKIAMLAATCTTFYYVFFERSYIFSPFIILSIAVIVAYKAVDIDMVNGTYRNYTWLLGFKFGDTEPLPAVKYIVIKDTVFSFKKSIGDGRSYEDNYEVALVCEGKIKIPLLYSVNEQKIIALATEISERLKCPLEDLTHEHLLNQEAS
jgi:hypothetical protein